MWLSHVTHVNESWHTCEWVMSYSHIQRVKSHKWLSHVTHVNESCHTCEWVMAHMWMSHVIQSYTTSQATQVTESCHTCEWVMSHMWMSHGTHVNEQYHANGPVPRSGGFFDSTCAVLPWAARSIAARPVDCSVYVTNPCICHKPIHNSVHLRNNGVGRMN